MLHTRENNAESMNTSSRNPGIVTRNVINLRKKIAHSDQHALVLSQCPKAATEADRENQEANDNEHESSIPKQFRNVPALVDVLHHLVRNVREEQQQYLLKPLGENTKGQEETTNELSNGKINTWIIISTSLFRFINLYTLCVKKVSLSSNF